MVNKFHLLPLVPGGEITGAASASCVSCDNVIVCMHLNKLQPVTWHRSWTRPHGHTPKQ